jgi:predicted aspartyl protease
MRVRSARSWIAAAAILITGEAASAAQLPVTPFKLLSGHKIVVRGTIEGGHELNMLLDTGADCTVIDRRIVRRLGLPLLPHTVEYVAVGKVEKAPLAQVRDLRVGTISTSLACIAGTVPVDGIDMILGLNVLRTRNFAIDYDEHKIVFGPCDMHAASAPFEPDRTLVVIKAKVHDQTIRMLVDTGAASFCLFEDGPRVWQYRRIADRAASVPHMGGASRSIEVPLRALKMGPTEWKELTAVVVDNPRPERWDAVLGVGSLGLKRIHFDFERRLLSWVK